MSLSTYQTQSYDTSIETELIQLKLWRKLSIAKKAQLIANWTKGCYQISLQGILNRYPDANSQQIKAEFAKLTLEKSILKLIKLNSKSIMLTDPISLALTVAGILEELEIPYLVGGSLASTLFGEPRSTQDIDLIIDLELDKINLFINAFTPQFYLSESAIQEAIQSQSSFNLIDTDSLGKVDIFILKQRPLNQTEFKRRQKLIVQENPAKSLYVSTPEDAILQKIIWYKMTNQSDKQWRDILGIIKLQDSKLDRVYLQKWAAELNLLPELNLAFSQSGLSI
ncbi:MAG: hypothetical protein AB4041_21215 [Microcystaceae cyanobacterium]